MVGWHHWLNGCEFEQAPGDAEGQGSLVCCRPWGRKESDSTKWLNDWTDLRAGTGVSLWVITGWWLLSISKSPLRDLFHTLIIAFLLFLMEFYLQALVLWRSSVNGRWNSPRALWLGTQRPLGPDWALKHNLSIISPLQPSAEPSLKPMPTVSALLKVPLYFMTPP